MRGISPLKCHFEVGILCQSCINDWISDVINPLCFLVYGYAAVAAVSVCPPSEASENCRYSDRTNAAMMFAYPEFKYVPPR